jgi:hypothetical protein
MSLFRLVGLFSLILTIGISSSAFAKHTPSRKPAEALSSVSAQQIYEEYGIAVSPGNDVNSAGDFENGAALLLDHLRKTYTRAFINGAQLKRVFLHYNVQYNYTGPSVAAYTLPGEIHLSMPRSPYGSCGAGSPESTEDLNCQMINSGETRTFDHELFHAIDFALNTYEPTSESSQAWTAANPPSFAYRGTGLAMQKQTFTEATPFKNAPLSKYMPGFITQYAAASMMEDKAETFAWYVESPKSFLGLMKNDTVLTKKLHIVLQMMEQACPDKSAWPVEFHNLSI